MANIGMNMESDILCDITMKNKETAIHPSQFFAIDRVV